MATSSWHLSGLQLELRTACTIPHALFFVRKSTKYVILHFQTLTRLCLGAIV